MFVLILSVELVVYELLNASVPPSLFLPRNTHPNPTCEGLADMIFFLSPALSAYGCSFEDNLCIWTQGAEDDLDWQRRSGPTETPNTGPAGDHTSGTGQYLYIESSPPSVKGNVAQLKSLLLPPAGEKGYCFSFWYHMFGATVGSLKMILKTTDPLSKTTSGNQGDEWQVVQTHVTLQKVHQVILEATVGGGAGDIALDDISFVSGPCPASVIKLYGHGNGLCNRACTYYSEQKYRLAALVSQIHHITEMKGGVYVYMTPFFFFFLGGKATKRADRLVRTIFHIL
uniref:MAM domain-containing protein n=1 Tax=Myripristis murdjan TaxID=586833 RepID=A0A667XQ26_9TELE